MDTLNFWHAKWVGLLHLKISCTSAKCLRATFLAFPGKAFTLSRNCTLSPSSPPYFHVATSLLVRCVGTSLDVPKGPDFHQPPDYTKRESLPRVTLAVEREHLPWPEHGAVNVRQSTTAHSLVKRTACWNSRSKQRKLPGGYRVEGKKLLVSVKATLSLSPSPSPMACYPPALPLPLCLYLQHANPLVSGHYNTMKETAARLECKVGLKWGRGLCFVLKANCSGLQSCKQTPADMPGCQDRVLQQSAVPCGRVKVGLHKQPW